MSCVPFLLLLLASFSFGVAAAEERNDGEQTSGRGRGDVPAGDERGNVLEKRGLAVVALEGGGHELNRATGPLVEEGDVLVETFHETGLELGLVDDHVGCFANCHVNNLPKREWCVAPSKARASRDNVPRHAGPS
jgi:hypothetical protein